MNVDPPEHLRKYIKQYSILEHGVDTRPLFIPAWAKHLQFFLPVNVVDMILPDGKILNGYPSLLAGCITHSLRYVDESISPGMIAVEFQPMTLHYYLDKDISFLTNNSCHADEVFPGSGDVLLAMQQTNNSWEHIDMINAFMEKTFQNFDFEPNPYVQQYLDDFEDHFVEYGENFLVSEIQRTMDISQRHFRRLFEQIIGIPPKIYYRMRKIEYILKLVHNKPGIKFQDIIKGYSDQSHFIRDFTRFTGMKPGYLQNLFSDFKLKKVYDYL